MKKAGGIVAIIAGVFSIVAAIITLMFGGLGSAFKAEGANTIVGLGWGGLFFSFIVIILGAIIISAKSKLPSILLILASIAGAILGGTLVAIFMALSAVGGILAMIGTQSPPTNNSAPPQAPIYSNQPDTNTLPNTKQFNFKKWGIAAIFILPIVILVAYNLSKPPHSQTEAIEVAEATTEKIAENPLEQLANAQASNLQPEGELGKIFELGGDHTDLQRENKLKEIKGKIVDWKLQVFDVTKADDEYKIQTGPSIDSFADTKSVVSTFVYITPRDKADIAQIEGLKTGDYVHIKGVIDDVFMRNIVIKPAILFKSDVQQTVKSAECTKELMTSIEKLVCNDEDLSQLNQKAEELLKQSNPLLVSSYQTAVEQKRNNCLDINCVRNFYLTNIQIIKATNDVMQLIKENPKERPEQNTSDSITEQTSTTTETTTGETHQDSETNVAPSIACKTTDEYVEMIICSDKKLAQLDVELYKLYQKALVVLNKQDTINVQKDWVAKRNSCQDYECIQNAYQAQITSLEIEVSETEGNL